MDFLNELKARAEEINGWLSEYFLHNDDVPDKINEAMNYSVSAGGKRVRPVLMCAAYEMFSGKKDSKDIKSFACAIEMIHTYSLIHDDLPAMDDSPLRRGRATNHTVFGEDIAILAGDGLLNLAFEVMSSAEFDSKRAIKAIKIISENSGRSGMIGGQVIDVESEGVKIGEDVLRVLQIKKTSALLCASLCAGAALAGASDKDIENMRLFGINLGLAFQIKDDILDVTGDAEKMGKPVGGDAEKDKNTYVSLLGIEGAQRLLNDYTENAYKYISAYENSEFLREFTDYLLKRDM